MQAFGLPATPQPSSRKLLCGCDPSDTLRKLPRIRLLTQLGPRLGNSSSPLALLSFRLTVASADFDHTLK